MKSSFKKVNIVILMAVALLTGMITVAQQHGKQVPPVQQFSPGSLDTTAIERITGIKGQYNSGEYKVTIPQNDLSIMVDSFKIIPAMGLGTWIAFTPSPEGVMVMGDI